MEKAVCAQQTRFFEVAVGADAVFVMFQPAPVRDASLLQVDKQLDLDALKKADTAAAKKELMKLYGVGNKVSDCILLFGMGRFDSFPVDVWIKRIMEYCYFGSEQQSIKTISEFAAERYGRLGGIAQQYLFFYARECRIGVNNGG